MEKKTGGMKIKNLKVHSEVLNMKMKWLWKYSRDQNQLWGRVIKSKYEQKDNWMTKKVTTPYGVTYGNLSESCEVKCKHTPR